MAKNLKHIRFCSAIVSIIRAVYVCTCRKNCLFSFQQKWRGSIEVEASSHSCLKLERQESKGWLLTQYLGVFLWWDYKSFDGTHNRWASNVIEPAFFLTSSSWIKWQRIEKHYIFIQFIVALYEQLMFVNAEKKLCTYP